MTKNIIVSLTFLFIFFSAISQISPEFNPPPESEKEEEPKQIEIVYAGTLTIDQDKYPLATIFNSDDIQQVQFKHQGSDMWCDLAILYKEENIIKAYGNVFFQQGDSLKMNSNYVEYNGNTKIATAKENVSLSNNDMLLETQEIIFDRNTQQAYYPNNGKITDKENVLTSKNGKYFVEEKRNEFITDVKITNPDFVLNSTKLDYYHTTGYAYLLGASTIEGKDYTVYTEKGFYDTKIEQGYFNKNPKINYDNKIIVGDSLYFDNANSFSSATNKIKITDTINNVVIRGNYAEVYKKKDSLFIEKKAVVVSKTETDSTYVHGKRILVTGVRGQRIVRAFPKARIFKKDMQGKCDSIHSSQKTGLTQLIGKPVIWNGNNQITGDSIHILANVNTEKIDSLKVFNNAFIIEKDTLSDGYNQVIGKVLYGKIVDNKLKKIDIKQNTQVIYYVYDDKNNLVGINNTKCSRIQIRLDKKQQMKELAFYTNVDGSISPEDKYPKEKRLFSGFVWRGNEKIDSLSQIFTDEVDVINKIDINKKDSLNNTDSISKKDSIILK